MEVRNRLGDQSLIEMVSVDLRLFLGGEASSYKVSWERGAGFTGKVVGRVTDRDIKFGSGKEVLDGRRGFVDMIDELRVCAALK